eukprot:jgi/Bigna1/139763/aug1.52_g14471
MDPSYRNCVPDSIHNAQPSQEQKRINFDSNRRLRDSQQATAKVTSHEDVMEKGSTDPYRNYVPVSIRNAQQKHIDSNSNRTVHYSDSNDKAASTLIPGEPFASLEEQLRRENEKLQLEIQALKHENKALRQENMTLKKIKRMSISPWIVRTTRLWQTYGTGLRFTHQSITPLK